MYKLFIVDDDETLLEGLSCAVKWESFGVSLIGTAIDGMQAMELLQHADCDILLTDIRMGRMDGLQLVEGLQKQGRQIKVIMMSAYEDFSHAQKALRLGVGEYLIKPIDLDQLRDTIEKIISELDQKREYADMISRAASRMQEINSATLETCQRTYSALNTNLMDDLLRSLEKGGINEIERDYIRFRDDLLSVGDGSLLFALSAIGLLLCRIERSGCLSGNQIQRLEAVRVDMLRWNSPKEALKSVNDFLHDIAGMRLTSQDSTDQAIKRAKQYIEEHYTESGLRMSDVAKYVGISKNYFSSVFSGAEGCSFSDYITALRMREAQNLLMNTNLKTYEIASRVGYDNAAYFSTSFKRFTGYTVSQYRNRFSKK